MDYQQLDFMRGVILLQRSAGDLSCYFACSKADQSTLEYDVVVFTNILKELRENTWYQESDYRQSMIERFATEVTMMLATKKDLMTTDNEAYCDYGDFIDEVMDDFPALDVEDWQNLRFGRVDRDFIILHGLYKACADALSYSGQRVLEGGVLEDYKRDVAYYIPKCASLSTIVDCRKEYLVEWGLETLQCLYNEESDDHLETDLRQNVREWAKMLQYDLYEEYRKSLKK